MCALWGLAYRDGNHDGIARFAKMLSTLVETMNTEADVRIAVDEVQAFLAEKQINLNPDNGPVNKTFTHILESMQPVHAVGAAPAPR